MKVNAFITDHQTIDRTIAHLKLTFVAAKPPLLDHLGSGHTTSPFVVYLTKAEPKCKQSLVFLEALTNNGDSGYKRSGTRVSS
jgi:hypothetical protein